MNDDEILGGLNAKRADRLPVDGMNSSANEQEEERKREAADDPLERWLPIRQSITWAEANWPPELRRNRPRWHGRAATNRQRLLGERMKTPRITGERIRTIQGFVVHHQGGVEEDRGDWMRRDSMICASSLGGISSTR